ncbi:MerR family transcriptional regulator [Actinoallomurus sp. NPDC052274]|uniref:MerR family transcriptional regulator n=1 Tax=Actinoallomurus sp. NPDC052274 TaxID=3155420 RepID=UPI003412F79F
MLMRVNEGYLPIGRFARLCRLSVKQLRNYDDLGLLVPAHVDPDTGYRYYRPDQARDALVIGLLRSLDVPLPAIGRVLTAGTGALGGVRDAMEADLARRRRNLAALERILADGLPRPDVSLVREPARRVAAVRDVAPPDGIGAVTSACVARLMDACAAAGVVRAPIGLFPLDLTSEVLVTVGVETDTAVPGTAPDVLRGGLFASATHVGPYDQIGLTAHALLAWAGDRGHTPAGALREVYVSDPASTPPERLVTHLMIEVKESE